ncbi:hypothetical protein [Deinococcus sp. ME38]|uniref:hypothetical protein n=1 Tax=Deinococcus sp. ME38 TaxID=3400344 RepID=UPI003B5CC1FC
MNIDDVDNQEKRAAESESDWKPFRQISYNSTANLGLLPGSDPFPIDVPQPKKPSKDTVNENKERGIK